MRTGSKYRIALCCVTMLAATFWGGRSVMGQHVGHGARHGGGHGGRHVSASHSPVRHGTSRHHRIGHRTVRHSSVRHPGVHHRTVRHVTPHHSSVRHGTSRHHRIGHRTVGHVTRRHSNVRHGISIHNIGFHGTSGHGGQGYDRAHRIAAGVHHGFDHGRIHHVYGHGISHHDGHRTHALGYFPYSYPYYDYGVYSYPRYYGRTSAYNKMDLGKVRDAEYKSEKASQNSRNPSPSTSGVFREQAAGMVVPRPFVVVEEPPEVLPPLKDDGGD